MKNEFLHCMFRSFAALTVAFGILSVTAIDANAQLGFGGFSFVLQNFDIQGSEGLRSDSQNVDATEVQFQEKKPNIINFALATKRSHHRAKNTSSSSNHEDVDACHADAPTLDDSRLSCGSVLSKGRSRVELT